MFYGLGVFVVPMTDLSSSKPALVNDKRDPSWSSWRWQLGSSVRTVQAAAEVLGGYWGSHLAALAKNQSNAMGDTRLTPYLLSLVDADDPRDPIALQHLPDARELAPTSFAYDEVWERAEDFADGGNRMIQQKYPDIVLLRISNTCHSYCRFCFEKERTLLKSVPTLAGPEQFKAAAAYIAERPRVRQVLLSGGDPLLMSEAVLAPYLETLAGIAHVRTIRLNTRTLLHNPFRITPELVDLFSRVQKDSWTKRERGVSVELGVHFNHPRELTPTALGALRALSRSGIAVYNQTVLLKGINDDIEILATLFRALREEGVFLHYLSQAMAVPGTDHFRTRVRDGQALMRALRRCQEFRGQLPYFELSHHAGKQIIPDTMHEFFYEDTLSQNKTTRRIIRFLSDITGTWEEFPDGE